MRLVRGALRNPYKEVITTTKVWLLYCKNIRYEEGEEIMTTKEGNNYENKDLVTF